MNTTAMIKAYRLDDLPESAELGPGTVIEYYPECGTCGQGSSIARVVELELNLLYWGGGDIIGTSPSEYVITEQLMLGMRQAELTGYDVSEVKVLTDELADDAAVRPRIPRMYWLKPHSTVDGPFTNYLSSGVCKTCERTIWVPKFKLEDLLTGLPRASVLRRESWHGEDVFRGIEPGTFFISERVVRVLEELGSKDYRISTVDWV